MRGVRYKPIRNKSKGKSGNRVDCYENGRPVRVAFGFDPNFHGSWVSRRLVINYRYFRT